MKQFYLGRMRDGWTIPEIDETDFFYFIELTAYDLENSSDECFIDDVI